MSKRQFVFQVGLLIILGLLSCAQSRAQSADCVPNAPVVTKGSTTTIGPVSFPNGCKFNFVFHALQLTGLSCTGLTVTASAVSASTVQGILTANSVQGTPIVYNESKKPIVYTLTGGSSCTILSPPTYDMTVFANFSATNPRLGRNSATEGFSFGIAQYAPFGTDPVSDSVEGTSDFFVFDLALGAAFPGANTAPATFCGFSTPLQPTLDLSDVPTFNVGARGRSLNWRFQLVPQGQGNSCPASSTNTVAGAVALLSVAQYDMSFTPPKFVKFVTIQSGGGGTFNPVSPALFSYNPSSFTYSFVQDIGNLDPRYLYIGTAVFLSNNTSPQSSAFILR